MAMPETDLLRIGHWCRARVPEHLWDEVRVEAEFSDRHVTVIETRPPWDGKGDWTRRPIARLRYTASSGQWTLHWTDQNARFHLYKDLPPAEHVQLFLDFLGSGQDPIFWG